ncbi:MAG: hypothetical protein AAF412_06650 [Pseudomonadota bacterium]
MSIYLMGAAVAVLVLTLGGGFYRSWKQHKTLTGQIDFLTKASLTCANRASVACDKIDDLKAEHQKEYDFKKKANEHQRVLLASLNRQVHQLENFMTQGMQPVQAPERVRMPERAMPMVQEQLARTRIAPVEAPNDVKVDKSSKGLLKLEEMFKAAVAEEFAASEHQSADAYAQGTPPELYAVPQSMTPAPYDRRAVNG